MEKPTVKIILGKYENEINNSINELIEKKIVTRIWEKDFTVWSNSPQEVTNRLDWLFSADETLSHINEINSFIFTVKN